MLRWVGLPRLRRWDTQAGPCILIGIAAPILLLLSRMAQGFATGGQYGTVATYLSEIATKGRRGFWSSFQYVTLIGGQPDRMV